MKKRRQAVADMVNQLGEVTLAQLKAAFPDVSEVTLRTDLRALDKERQIVRIHGGARSISTVAGNTNDFFSRSNLHAAEKKQIAEKAATLIQPYDSIFISAGSTCAELARALPSCPLFVFTDNIGALVEIPRHSEIISEVFGGRFDYNTMRVYGVSIAQAIESIHFHTTFIGTSGFHPKYGFGYLSLDMTDSLNKIIDHSEKVVILMDSSKVNYTSFPRILSMEKADIVVTDDQIEKETVSVLKAKGITVI